MRHYSVVLVKTSDSNHDKKVVAAEKKGYEVYDTSDQAATRLRKLADAAAADLDVPMTKGKEEAGQGSDSAE